MKGIRSFFFVLLLVQCSFFCGTYHPPDVDDQQPKALRLTPDILIKDSIGPDMGDKVDWKDFSYFKEARATIIFMFGEPFKPHRVEGEITLFNFQGEIIEKRPVLSGKREYPFTITVNPDEHYFFKLEARSGSSPYMVETKIEPLDPCSKCLPDEVCCRPKGICCKSYQTCIEGECVFVEEGKCHPPCSKGLICWKEKCVEPCGGWCPKGKYCDKEINRCVSRITKPSCPPCPEGFICKKGMCVAGATPNCPPSCPAGTECNPETGLCESTISDISGIIVTYYPVQGGTELIINKGSADGIKTNMRGVIIGVKNGNFVITEVYQGRCKAKTKLSKDAVSNYTKVVIKP